MKKLLYILSGLIFLRDGSLASDKMRVAEIQPRIENLEKLLNQLKKRANLIKDELIKNKEVKTIKSIYNHTFALKQDFGLYDPDVSKEPENIVVGDMQKYSNLAGVAITINLRTCNQVVADKENEILKETKPDAHKKLIINLSQNCKKVKDLQFQTVKGQDINALQLQLDEEFNNLYSRW